ncbi:hypothetical protein IQ278_02170 [Tolypothrix sp. LEGE 11397]|nr:hypothetical protein FDUTEX481_01796 [Tolypothrix sp. PCC 7601]MBE9080963.1 hypothetical protein [Tolypothrix sp. LEGE 11397]UYD30144.1 hypothetical protein HGR01_29220 [Tolypothrix sp. PCC 7712]UYD37927.1 hypothetical protein HG267_25345 [Tolypothrix sp. PCC 7601]
MKEELLNKVADQAREEGNTMSRFVVELLNLLLLSPLGQELQESARRNRRTLIQELRNNLILFNEQISSDEIRQLAQESQRNSDQMLIYLVLLGLQIYKDRLEAKLE